VLAGVYEMSMDTVFLECQDAMQRQTLVSPQFHMRSQPHGSVRKRGLELASGTGHFATFIKVACSIDCVH
jgi:hypothetical protein